jgi:glycerol kinase
LWKLNTRFMPKIDAGERESRYTGWRRAVRSAIGFAKE